MSTTSLKLPQQLKKRAEALAKKKGLSTHAFLVNAIEAATEAEESRLRMLTTAKKALARARKTNTGFAADEVHEYIRNRADGKHPDRPKEKAVWRD